MGELLAADGTRIRLEARVVVGRARTAGLRLESMRASGEHAVLAWQGRTWSVRDLGSRNGTFVDGRRLLAGETALVAVQSRVRFGDESEFVWLDTLPPAAVAVNEAGHREVAVGQTLALPSVDNPEVVVFRQPTGWVVEDDAGERPAPAEVVAGGQRWMLALPEVLLATVEAGAPRLAEVSLHLGVSRDEEFVQAEWQVGSTTHRPDFRAHHYLLVILARLRLAEPDEGWVEAERLSRMLALDRGHLNVQVHRARREVEDIGVQDAAGLVERRPGTLMRLGLRRVQVDAL